MTKRQEKIKHLLVLCGTDNSYEVIKTVDSFICFITDDYLDKFIEYVLKNWDKYKKPILNVTTSATDFKKHMYLLMIRKGEMKLESIQDTKAFLYEFFKGKRIVNNVKGLFKSFVTISLSEKGRFINEYANEELNSKKENEFIKWCFENQKKIGVITIVVEGDISLPAVVNKNKVNTELLIENKKVNELTNKLSTKVRI